MKRNKGFTLAELLVVVGIIAVLVAISIPVFASQLHKARVTTDWANLRALYAEIQTEYITNSEDWSFINNYSVSGGQYQSAGNTITYNGNTIVELDAGSITFINNTGSQKHWDESYAYVFSYSCNEGHPEHTLSISNLSIVANTN